jgi:DNA polymerase-3 subunit beta
MEVICEKNTLAQALQFTSRAINARSPLPILSHVLLNAEHDSLKLAATDLDLGISLEFPVEVVDSGSVACPAKLLGEIISKLPNAPIRLRSHYDGRLELTCGRSRFEIGTLPAEEFPSMPKFGQGNSICVSQKLFKAAIKRIILAVATAEESRAIMTGVLLHINQEQLLLIGTDGRRMAYQELITESAFEKVSIVVPGRAMQELARLMGDSPDPIELLFSEGQLFCKISDTGQQGIAYVSLHCRLLDGIYPDYNKVLPKSFTRSVRIGREALLAALQRMLILAQEKLSPNLVVFDIHEDLLKISAHTPDLGIGHEEVNIVLEGEPLKIAFNGRYIVDVLSTLDCEEIVLNFQDDSRSAQLSISDTLDFRYVLMPVKLRESLQEEVAS